MLPIKLDHENLPNLPLPTDKAINGVFLSMQAILSEKVIPHFSDWDEVSATEISRLRRDLFFRRMEDEDNRIGLATLLVRHRHNSTILIHERLFDFMAFVLPSRAEVSISGGTREEQMVLAFSEFFLRHHFEHVLFPERSEIEVIGSDMTYATEWAKREPASYQMLREVLSDRMSGIKGEDYLSLIDRAQRGEKPGFKLGRVVAEYAREIAGLPGRFLPDLFPDLDRDIKTRVLNTCFSQQPVPIATTGQEGSQSAQSAQAVRTDHRP